MLFAGKRAFIAGIADDNGYGWAIAKSLAAAGAEILVGTWVPVSEIYNFLLDFSLKSPYIYSKILMFLHFLEQALNIFETSLRRGKFDESRMLESKLVIILYHCKKGFITNISLNASLSVCQMAL